MEKRRKDHEKTVRAEWASAVGGAGNDYKNQVNRLRNAVRERAKSLDEQLKRIPK